LNHISLNDDEMGLFIGPNEPHAYIKGDILECMACSDNVVRAGLTNKLMDTKTLCSMLTYNAGQPSTLKGIKSKKKAKGVDITNFSPPVSEFMIDKLVVSGMFTLIMEPTSGPSILLCVSGSGKGSLGHTLSHDITPGSAFYVLPNTKVYLSTEGDADKDLVVYRVLGGFE
jgi:mannose-6-phosphate isomerase